MTTFITEVCANNILDLLVNTMRKQMTVSHIDENYSYSLTLKLRLNAIITEKGVYLIKSLKECPYLLRSLLIMTDEYTLILLQMSIL